MNLASLASNLAHHRASQSPIIVGAAIALCAAVLGLLLSLVGPIYTAVGLAALVGAVWAIGSLENALLSVVAIALLLPYATMPFKVVFTPNFLDIAMVAVYGIYALQWMTGDRRKLQTTPAHTVIVLFLILCLFSFLAGLRNAGMTSNKLRQFAELMLAIGLGLILVDILQTPEQVKRFINKLIMIGSVSALIGIILWVLPDQITESVLSRLSIIGYPSGGVVRYVEENPELSERAIGTSIDPNAFGGLMVMMGSVAAAQAAYRHTDSRNRIQSFLTFGLIGIAVLLSFSRGSMLALTVSLVFVGTMLDRRVILLLLAGIVVFLLLPWTQTYVQRLIEGFQGADLATQMRFGEYKDALILINRYPLLGVGFTGAPDIDIYLGVANLYLTIASNMGILGLLAFIGMFYTILAYAWRASGRFDHAEELGPVWIGLIGSLIGILVSGLFDHFFFNLEFFHISTLMWILIGCLLATTKLTLEHTTMQQAAMTDLVATEAVQT